MEKYDVVIVGGACAGLSAALYTARRALKTLVITKDIGGQLALTTEIENYPGTGTLTGPELAERFRKQAEAAGAKIEFGEVTSLKKEGDVYKLESTKGELEAPAVILAFGLDHQHLGVPGEEEFTGKGISYCATCDGPLFKNKVVGVVGGGNSALDAVEYLSKIVEKVYMFVRKEEFRGEQVLIDAVKAAKNVEIMFRTQIKEISGDKFLNKVQLENNETNETSELDLNGLFIEIGWVTKTQFLAGLADLNERGFITVNNKNETSTPGLFAAGDVTDSPFKQAVISAGDGAKAGLSAYQYVQKIRGNEKASVAPDLTRRKDEK